MVGFGLVGMICRFGLSIRLSFIGVVALGILYIWEEGVLGV